MSPWLEALLDLLFPRQAHCLLCHLPMDDEQCVCEHCLNEMPRIPGMGCPICGGMLADDDPVCLACADKTVAYEHCWAAVLYDEIVRQAVYQLKYSKQQALAGPLGRMMVDKLRGLPVVPSIDVVVPVPLSLQRMQQRGFNQAELLARPLAQYFGAVLLTDLLLRSADTQPQWQLGPQQRLHNVGHAFVVQHGARICNCTVMIVDDIYTTGATVQACAQMLRQAGCGPIFVATFATVLRRTL